MVRTKDLETNQKPHQVTGVHGTRNMGTNHKMNQSDGIEHWGNFAKSTIQISHQTSGTTVDHLFRTHHRSTDHKSNKVAANHNSVQDIGTEYEENFAKSTIHISVCRVTGQNRGRGDQSETNPDQWHRQSQRCGSQSQDEPDHWQKNSGEFR